MSCCIPLIQPFFNQDSTSVSYPATLKKKFGEFPKVMVLYWDSEAKEYYVSNNFSRVEYASNAVNVYHGGPSSGVVKIY